VGPPPRTGDRRDEDQGSRVRSAQRADPVSEINDVLRTYFDGLYTSNTALLATVFHPAAIYATATEGALLRRTMDEYLPIVAERESPAARQEERHDRIVSIDLVGPVTALAKVECAIAERQFIDLLSLVHLDGRWQIIAKVFHFDIRPLPGSGASGSGKDTTCPTST
jgi:hypothetical protein